MVEGIRSVKGEIDYSKKEGARSIVAQPQTGDNSLRAKILRNLECVRQGKNILPSEKSMMAQSIASTNARLQRARANKVNMALPGVEEEPLACCDVTETPLDEECIAINERISSQINYEPRLQLAYNSYRVNKGLDPINFEELAKNDQKHLV